LGATSFVADSLLPLLRDTCDPVPFSGRLTPTTAGRGQLPETTPVLQMDARTTSDEPETGAVLANPAESAAAISDWISLVPIWALPDFFDLLAAAGARRVVALSSTSVHTRKASADPADRALAARLAEGEGRFAAWARARGVQWLVLRPTLIYGYGRDRNVAEIARFIRRFGVFPVLGAARGLRQPIHVDDVAAACCAALRARHLTGRGYEIAGGEALSYREMVGRVFDALGKPRRILRVSLWAFAAAVACARLLPRYRRLTIAMARRMNEDMAFDCSAAGRDLGLSPRAFRPGLSDLAGTMGS
jgi:nucleoside-diphosphate-sugar epimerase